MKLKPNTLAAVLAAVLTAVSASYRAPCRQRCHRNAGYAALRGLPQRRIALQKWLLAVPGAKLGDWKAEDLHEDGLIDIYDMSLLKRALLQ